MAQGLRLGHGRTHGLGALLELDADALAVDRLFVAVPCKALDSHLRDIAAETSIAVDERRAGTRARRRKRGGKASGAAADDENVRFKDHINRTAGFDNLVHRALSPGK